MSAFDAGSIKGDLILETDHFSEALRESETQGGEFAASLGELFRRIGGSPELAEMGESISHTLSAAFSGNWEGAALGGIHTVTIAVGEMFDTLHESVEEWHAAGLAAEKAGVSVEFLTSLQAAAKDYGVMPEDLGNSFRYLERNAAEAIDGQKNAIEAFKLAGISVEDLKTKLRDTPTLFYAFKDGLAAIADQNQKTLAATTILGRGGETMVPFLDADTAKIKAFVAEYQLQGAAISKQDVAAADAIDEAQHRIEIAWDAGVKKLEEPVIFWLSAHADEIVADVGRVSDWIGEKLPDAIRSMDTLFQDSKPFVDAFISVIGAAQDAVENLADKMGLFDTTGENLPPPSLKPAPEKVRPQDQDLRHRFNPNDPSTWHGGGDPLALPPGAKSAADGINHAITTAIGNDGLPDDVSPGKQLLAPSSGISDAMAALDLASGAKFADADLIKAIENGDGSVLADWARFSRSTKSQPGKIADPDQNMAIALKGDIDQTGDNQDSMFKTDVGAINFREGTNLTPDQVAAALASHPELIPKWLAFGDAGNVTPEGKSAADSFEKAFQQINDQGANPSESLPGAASVVQQIDHPLMQKIHSAVQAINQPSAAPDAAGGIHDGGTSPGNSTPTHGATNSGSPEVTIHTINATFDPRDLAKSIASAVTPPLLAALARQKADATAAAAHYNAVKSVQTLGGG